MSSPFVPSLPLASSLRSMTVCKVILYGKNLRKPVEKILKCLRELTKNPFSIEWTIDSKKVDFVPDLDLTLFKPKKSGVLPGVAPPSVPIKEKYKTILENIKDSVSEVSLRFKIPNEPPFSLIGNVQQVYRVQGLDLVELVYHSWGGKYGYQKYLKDGTLEVSEKSREQEESMDCVDGKGLPVIIGGLDLNTSSTFLERIPKGDFADFLKEHDLEY